MEKKIPWQPFNVILVVSPEISKPIERHIGFLGERSKEILVKGNNFKKEISVVIERKGYKLPISQKTVESPNSLRIILNLRNAPLGKYRLALHNKKGKKLVVPDFLTVKEREKPNTENWDIVKRSLAFPGWGEIYAGNKYTKSSYKYRGIAYSTLFLATLFYNLKLRQNFENKNKEIQTTFISGTSAMALTPEDNETARAALALTTLTRTQTQKNKMVKISSQSSTAIQLLLGIYLLQLFDAYRIQSVSNRTGFQINFYERKLSSFQEMKYDVYYEFEF